MATAYPENVATFIHLSFLCFPCV